MTPIEKAKEIAQKFEILESIDTMDIQVACNMMHEWTKEQLIEKVCEWLDKNASGYAQIISNTSQSTSIFGTMRYCGFSTDILIEDIKKAMEEQL